jgi:BASS family bile acid:Na+ symporter
MSVAKLLSLVIMLSMAGILLSVALEARLRDLTYLLRHPGLLVRSIVAMNLVMPLLAVTMALTLGLERPIAFALIAMALAPVPPILPGTELKAGGSRRFTMGLVVISCCLAIVFVPFAVGWIGQLAGHPIDVTPAQVARIVATWMLLPMLLGACVRAWSEKHAQAWARPIARASGVLLLVAIVPVLLMEWRYMLGLLGWGTLAIAAFALGGLGIGHLLGGPDPRQRTVLSLSTAMRHPGVAMAMLQVNEDRHVLLAAVLLVLLVSVAVVQPYVHWRSRVLERSPAPANTGGEHA